jgi:hypothetical protein
MGLELTPLDDDSPAGGTGGSVLDQIRAAVDEAKRSKHLNLGLPGRIGEVLKVRYRAYDDPVDGEGLSDRELNMDVLAAACECLLRSDGDGGWKPLLEDGVPVDFGSIGEVMGWDVKTVRDTLLVLFSGAPQPHAAIALHVRLLSRWMVGGVVDEEAVLGES